MADIDWNIIGQITADGRIRIAGFSVGGDKLFEEPVDLDEMIEALAASHEVPPDSLLSKAGRQELIKLASILSEAGTDVREKLQDDTSRSEDVHRRDSEDD